jgi:hypothetical protein
MKGKEHYLVISNENRLLGQIFAAYNSGRTVEGLTRLADDGVFENWVKNGLGSANVLAWIAPRPVSASARASPRARPA